MTVITKPKKNRSSTPFPGSSSKRPPGRLWVIVQVLAILAAVALVFSAGRAKPGTDDSSAGTSAFLPTNPNSGRALGPAPEGMVWIPGGEFSMGSDHTSELQSLRHL